MVLSRSRWPCGNVAWGCELGVPAALREGFAMAMTSVGPPPNWSVQTRVLATTGCPVPPIKARQVSRRCIRIRAWGSGEPMTNQSVARADKCHSLAGSGVGRKSQPMRSLTSDRTLLRCWMAVSSAQLHALGQRVSSTANMRHVSLAKGARGEPSQIEHAPGNGQVLETGGFPLRTDSCGAQTARFGKREPSP
jgi:hypothetical protein